MSETHAASELEQPAVAPAGWSELIERAEPARALCYRREWVGPGGVWVGLTRRGDWSYCFSESGIFVSNEGATCAEEAFARAEGKPWKPEQPARPEPRTAVERLATLYSVLQSPELRRAAGDALRACHGMRASLCIKRGEWLTYDDVADVLASTAEQLAAEVETRIRARLQRGVEP